ncbi:MAG: hypothetical protein AAFO74_13380 [Pseudomonadota bacterium]
MKTTPVFSVLPSKMARPCRQPQHHKMPTSRKPKQEPSMKHHTLLASTVLVLAASLAAPVASAACDISSTKCAVNDGKCNIKFRNRTGDTGGSDSSSNLKQTSNNQAIAVRAIDEKSKSIGNKLTIADGANNTMNIDKKVSKDKGFNAIHISSQNFNNVAPVTLSCQDIKAVLNGNGTCKVFNGKSENSSKKYSLGYQCDGSKVGGP